MAAFFMDALLLFLAWLLQIWILAELRRLEPRAWRLVASPGWLRVLSWQSLRFVQLGRYRRLRSWKLRRLGLALHSVQLLAVAAFTASVLLLVGY